MPGQKSSQDLERRGDIEKVEGKGIILRFFGAIEGIRKMKRLPGEREREPKRSRRGNRRARGGLDKKEMDG